MSHSTQPVRHDPPDLAFDGFVNENPRSHDYDAQDPYPDESRAGEASSAEGQDFSDDEEEFSDEESSDEEYPEDKVDENHQPNIFAIAISLIGRVFFFNIRITRIAFSYVRAFFATVWKFIAYYLPQLPLKYHGTPIATSSDAVLSSSQILTAPPSGTLFTRTRFYSIAFLSLLRDTYLNKAFAYLFIFRLVNAFILRTFFQPDEFFQSLEPAWAVAFGQDKGAWLTWEWKHQLRSSIHPFYFAIFYKAVSGFATFFKLSQSTRAALLVAAPKVAQVHFAALTDFFTWKLAQRIYGYGSRGEQAALIATIISPWQWFCSTRTFSNGLETTLTIVALNFWPWRWATWVPVPAHSGDKTLKRKHWGPNNPALVPGPKGSRKKSSVDGSGILARWKEQGFTFLKSTPLFYSAVANQPVAQNPFEIPPDNSFEVPSENPWRRKSEGKEGSDAVQRALNSVEGMPTPPRRSIPLKFEELSAYAELIAAHRLHGSQETGTADSSLDFSNVDWTGKTTEELQRERMRMEDVMISSYNPPSWERISPLSLGSPEYSKKRPILPLASLRLCLLLAALAVLLRPTNVIIWAVLGGAAFYSCEYEQRKMLAREAVLCGTFMLVVSTYADRRFYGFWTFPPLNFLYFNIAQSLAVFYGMNRLDYYLTEGYPLLLTTLLPFALYGLYTTLKHRVSLQYDRWQTVARVQLATVCIAMPIVLSLIAHKEVRFIYPLLPCLHVLAAVPMVQWFAPAIYIGGSRNWPRILSLLFILLANIVIAGYVSLYHGSGVIGILEYLRHRQEVNEDRFNEVLKQRSTGSFPGHNITAGFLMPCHSTPWRSHMVYPAINAWALTCEPPINMNAAEKAIYRDEADQFYDDPSSFLSNNMVGGLRHIPRRPSYTPGSRSLSPPRSSSRESPRHEWPDYLIFFQQLEPTLKPLLRTSHYGECTRIFNSAWHDDWRRRGDVVVWCLDAEEKTSWRKELQRREDLKRDAQFDRILSAITMEPQKETGWKTVLPWYKAPRTKIGYFWYEVVLPFWHVMRFFLTPFQLLYQSFQQLFGNAFGSVRRFVRSLYQFPEACGAWPWSSREPYDIVKHQLGYKCPSLFVMIGRKFGAVKRGVWGTVEAGRVGVMKWVFNTFPIQRVYLVDDPELYH